MELWSHIPGYSWYLVSSTGRVRTVEKQTKFGSRTKKHSAKDLKPWISSGYPTLRLVADNGDQKHFRIHRLVASAFVPNPRNMPTVNHIDGDKENNRVENLEWASHSENAKHKCRVLRKNLGSDNGYSKLTEAEIPKIRNDHRLHREIAADYGVDKMLISLIKRRKIWKHVA